MQKSKTTVSYVVETDQIEYLETMAKSHDLPDASKALRVLLDFAMEDGDEQRIFQTVRCRRCG